MNTKVIPSRFCPRFLWKLPFMKTDKGLKFLEKITKDYYLDIRLRHDYDCLGLMAHPFPHPMDEMRKRYEHIVMVDVWTADNEIVVRFL